MSLSTLDPELAAFIAQMPPLPKGGTIEEQRATFDAWTISEQKSQEGQLPDSESFFSDLSPVSPCNSFTPWTVGNTTFRPYRRIRIYPPR